MKKVLSVLLVWMVLLCASASAETVTVSVWMDVDAVDVAMTQYESALGFSVAYDPENFALREDAADTFDMTAAPGAFITFQSVTDMSAQVLADGVVLQAPAEDAEVSDCVLGGMFADEIEVLTVAYAETAEGTEYVHAFYFLQREADVLMVETYYPSALEGLPLAELSAMLQSFALTAE